MNFKKCPQCGYDTFATADEPGEKGSCGRCGYIGGRPNHYAKKSDGIEAKIDKLMESV